MYDVEKHTVWMKVAADAMCVELLRQVDSLMTAEAGTCEADELARLSKLVADYEEVRWPIDKSPIKSSALGEAKADIERLRAALRSLLLYFGGPVGVTLQELGEDAYVEITVKVRIGDLMEARTALGEEGRG